MSKVNIEAKKERHRKLFEGQYHTLPGQIWFHFKRGVAKIFFFLLPSEKRLSRFMHPLDHMPAPRRLYTQMATFSIGLLILTSVNSTAASSGGENAGKEYLSLDISTSYITDEEGYIIKTTPLEGEGTYDQNRTERTEHEVKPGETLSMIAYRWGVSVSSIRYANPTLGSSDYLKVGQTLTIPPKDGVYVKVSSGSTLVALMDKYKGNLDKTKEFNAIEDDSQLIEGEEIFIVDGQPEVIYIATNQSSGSKDYGYVGGTYLPVTEVYEVIPNAEGWIRPTKGIISQGYRVGHYAYDVADRSQPPILAAASGTIVYASAGGWDGGYGTNIWIDHGNGYKSHYAHMEEIYVTTGDTVVQGQAIGKMGNTGRVYGATGIHLHFELEYNGTKISPSVMGVW
ncbi:MAG: M23 family metallopeptidase [Candidatus Gracilibacteria bacterium]